MQLLRVLDQLVCLVENSLLALAQAFHVGEIAVVHSRVVLRRVHGRVSRRRSVDGSNGFVAVHTRVGKSGR